MTIQSDKISSIIKERIDNFELNCDEQRGININIPGVSVSCLQEAVRQLSTAMVCTIEPCFSIAKSINDSKVECENIYPILKDKEHKKYGWYRKFEKKTSIHYQMN